MITRLTRPQQSGVLPMPLSTPLQGTDWTTMITSLMGMMMPMIMMFMFVNMMGKMFH